MLPDWQTHKFLLFVQHRYSWKVKRESIFCVCVLVVERQDGCFWSLSQVAVGKFDFSNYEFFIWRWHLLIFDLIFVLCINMYYFSLTLHIFNLTHFYFGGTFIIIDVFVLLQKHFAFIQICVFLSQFFVGYKFQVFSFFMKIFYDLLLTNTEYFYFFFLFALGIKKGRTCKSLFGMLVTLPLLYTLSTSIKVNANKLIQVSVHALTDYPFFLLITLGIMLCRYLSNNVVRNSDKFSFIFIFFSYYYY